MTQRKSLFDYANLTFMVLLCIITVYPFWYLLVVSLSTEEAFFRDTLHIIPKSLSLNGYGFVLSNATFYRSILISVGVTCLGTVSSLLLSGMGAYALSKKTLKGRNVAMFLIIITMFFHGGTIATYAVVNGLGLKNNLMVLILPTLFNTYNLILMKNYFEFSVPPSIEEAAVIDGCNDFGILFRVVLPVCQPILATIGLFYAVQFWNDWFTPMLYITQPKRYPLVTVVRNIIVASSGASDVPGVALAAQPDIIKAAALMMSIIPILMVYPFIQRYVVRGILLGAVKE